MSLSRSFQDFEKSVDELVSAVRRKHGSHDQSTHGRGGGVGGEASAAAALSSEASDASQDCGTTAVSAQGIAKTLEKDGKELAADIKAGKREGVLNRIDYMAERHEGVATMHSREASRYSGTRPALMNSTAASAHRSAAASYKKLSRSFAGMD